MKKYRVTLNLKQCPSCGSENLIFVEQDVSFPVSAKDSIIYSKIPHWICMTCDEKIFGLDAADEMEAQRNETHHILDKPVAWG